MRLPVELVEHTAAVVDRLAELRQRGLDRILDGASELGVDRLADARSDVLIGSAA